jgi:hypothetical protein
MGSIVGNRYYNDPQIGAIGAQLAQMYAPPSAQDMAAYATAQATRDKNSRLADLFNNPNDPNFDRRNIAVGNYAPSSSFYAVDRANATTQRGQDLSLRGTEYTSDNALKGNVFDTAFGALNPGQVRPAVPADVGAQFGLTRALDPVAGAPKPMTLAEVQGQVFGAGAKQFTPDQQLQYALGSQTPVKTVGPDGKATYSTPGGAIGQQVAMDTGAQAAKKSVILRDPQTGEQMRGYLDPSTGGAMLEDGTPAPPGLLPYNPPSTTGTPTDTGVGKTVQTSIDKQVIDVRTARNTAVQLRDLIQSSPASQGGVGWLLGTAQNLMQTGSELGSYFGGSIKDVTDQIQSGAAELDVAKNFDPNIPAIEMMGNLLAFQYAKTTTGERLSNEMLRNAKKALGLDGLTSNRADSIARLNTAVNLMNSQENILLDARKNGVSTPVPQPGAVDVGGASDGIVTVNTPEEARNLPSGTKFRDPNGNIRVVP